MRQALSRLLMRFHQWMPAAALLSSQREAATDPQTLDKLSYALLCGALTQPRQAQALARRFLETTRRTMPSLPPARQLQLAEIATRVELPSLALQLSESAAAGGGEEGLAAQKLASVLEREQNQCLKEELQQKIRHLVLPDDGSLLLLTPVSGAYMELWPLWLKLVRRHVRTQVVVMAMDDGALQALTGEPDVAVLDMREFFAWVNGKLQPQCRGLLWMLRVLVMRELVHSGHPTLVLDLDAMPIGDLPEMLSEYKGADVIAQKDYSIPVEVARQLGFVLCCGFLLVNPTASGRSLIDRLANRASVERDDQLALNHLLSVQGLTDQVEDANGLRFQSAGVKYHCPPVEKVSRTLESGSVVRHFAQVGQSVTEIAQQLGVSQEIQTL